MSVADRASEDREWVYGHVVVDEAQELSPMAWRVLARRCPSLSMTVVGDLDQTASAAGASDWATALRDITKSRHRTHQRWRVERLSVNYRTPRPFMDLAREVLLACGREPAPVESIRDGEDPVIVGLRAIGDVADLVATAARQEEAGRVAVITAPSLVEGIEDRLREVLPEGMVGHGDDRLDAVVTVLTVAQAKGLEFDDVFVAEPDLIDAEAARRGTDLYVALTRPTRSLTIAYSGDYPRCLPVRS
jgi:DNA helicase IV